VSDSKALAQGSASADADFRAEPVGAPIKGCTNPSWVDFRVVDKAGNPVKGVAWEIELPDGRKVSGTTDESGCAGTDGIDPGKCRISFPGGK